MKYLIPSAIGRTSDDVDSHSRRDVIISPQTAIECGRSNSPSNSKRIVISPVEEIPPTFKSTMVRWRRAFRCTVGFLACMSLVATVIVFPVPGVHAREGSRSNDGVSVKGFLSTLRGGDSAGPAASAHMHNQDPRSLAVALGITGNSAPMESTAIVVALGDGLEGKAALKVWSDFVLCAGDPATAVNMMDEGKLSLDCGCGGANVQLDRRRGHGRRRAGGVDQIHDRGLSESLFPPVWVITSDPLVDRAIREEMPHLKSFFVPGVLGTGALGNADPVYEGYELSSWSDVLDVFLSKNPGIDVFGIYGEGALPTIAMLPFMASSGVDSAGASGSCSGVSKPNGGGCAIESVLWPILSSATLPTAVLSRARAWWKSDDEKEVANKAVAASGGKMGDWMPDRFVAQIWCNRAMLAETKTEATSLSESDTVGSTGLKSLLRVIQRLVRYPGASGAILADGTKDIPSRFLHPPGAVATERREKQEWEKFSLLRKMVYDREQQEHGRQQKLGDPATVATDSIEPLLVDQRRHPLPKATFPIGALHFAVGFEADKHHKAGVWKIMPASWPRKYILEAVDYHGAATEGGDRESEGQEGLIVVTSVNCGYLDVAVNSMLSVRRAARHVKVLYVATDEMAFDFFDVMSPGHTVLMPTNGSEARQVTRAGNFGDEIFKTQTLLRPDVLLYITRQGYRALWVDSDTVWLGNILPILPNPQESKTTVAEVAVTSDGENVCTCLIYIDCTPNSVRLLEAWKQNIEDTNADRNQRAFQDPLNNMINQGLRVETLPEEVMPAGRDIFQGDILKTKYSLYRENVLIVHNNWIIGHNSKVQRFRKADLWEVGDWVFPRCSS